jgi:hypothetical protein
LDPEQALAFSFVATQCARWQPVSQPLGLPGSHGPDRLRLAALRTRGRFATAAGSAVAHSAFGENKFSRRMQI